MKTIKLQHWRAFQAEKPLEAAPVLDFRKQFAAAHYGTNTNPARAFTAKISDTLIAPVAFTS